jgi:hypothetical protein
VTLGKRRNFRKVVHSGLARVKVLPTDERAGAELEPLAIPELLALAEAGNPAAMVALAAKHEGQGDVVNQGMWLNRGVNPSHVEAIR